MIWAEPGDKIDFINGNHSTLEPHGPKFLRELAESVAREGMLGFEIGCYTGWTASQVIPTFIENGGSYHMLDWFRGSVDTRVGKWHWGTQDCKLVLLQTLKNLELNGWLDNVSVHICMGDFMAPLIKDGSLDYVYIGADHRYSPFKKDIQNWLPKIRKGGILCGHAFTKDVERDSEQWNRLCQEPEQDYYPSIGGHFGVCKAIKELLPGYWRIDNGLWAYRVN